jgi:SulP family sulfate permease
MVALAAVMMVVAVRTVDWHSIRPRVIRRMPRAEVLVMAVTVVTVVATGNLAIGVGIGAVLASLLLLQRASQAFSVTRQVAGDGESVEYRVRGALFFASSNDLAERFHQAGDPARVVIDFSESRIWDASSVAALDAIEEKYRREGITVEVRGLDERSARLHASMSGHLNGPTGD